MQPAVSWARVAGRWLARQDTGQRVGEYGPRTFDLFLLIYLALIVALTACATPGTLTPVLTSGGPLTAVEQAEVTAIEQVVTDYCRRAEVLTGKKGCARPRMILIGDRAGYSPSQNTLFIPRAYLLNNRAAIAHELAHWAYADSRPPGCAQPHCELNANYHAVEVLTWGFGVTREAALSLMRNGLAGAIGRPVPDGHTDPCVTLHNFEGRVGIALSMCAAGR